MTLATITRLVTIAKEWKFGPNTETRAKELPSKWWCCLLMAGVLLSLLPLV